MMQTLRYIANFLILVLVQMLLLNHIHLFGAQAYLYVMFLALLPTNIPTKYLLPIGFLVGLVIDVFSGTYGVHAAATTFVAFVRPFLLRLFIMQNDAMDETLSLAKQKVNFVWYVVAMVVLHHFALLMIEAFSFQYFGTVLLKTLISSIFTLILIFCILLFKKN